MTLSLLEHWATAALSHMHYTKVMCVLVAAWWMLYLGIPLQRSGWKKKMGWSKGVQLQLRGNSKIKINKKKLSFNFMAQNSLVWVVNDTKMAQK